AVDGVAANRKVGALPKRDRLTDELRAGATRAAAPRSAVTASYRAPRADPFTPLQWDMAQIGATPKGSYAREQGSHAVLVGIMDTGVDGTHPDIKANFNRALS